MGKRSKLGRKDVWKNGWTLPELRDQNLPVSVGFGTAAATTAIVGGGIMIMAYSDPHGRFTFYKKCGPLPRNRSLDAEMGGCGMLMNNLRQWIDKCVRQKAREFPDCCGVCLFPTMHFSETCVARGLTVTKPITPATVLRVAAVRVRVFLEAWVLVATRVRSYKISKTLMTVTFFFQIWW